MNKYRYLDLRIGARARLALLRKDADKLNAMPHRVNADKCNWRDVRYAKFSSTDTGLNAGFNETSRGFRVVRVPVWYCHTGPAFSRETWADEIENSPIDHRGWYADPDGQNTIRGFVVALPHGRYMGGYEMLDSGERVYFADLFDDAREAARFADGRAEYIAEQEREYQTRWRAAHDLVDNIDCHMRRLRELLILRHRPCLDYVRDEIESRIADIRAARDTLAGEYADIEV